MTPAQRPIDRLTAIMARLRDPEHGCPWDQAQNFATIAPYTIEEAYEVADAIARGDMPALKEELGDLLLQVVYHARMAEEAEAFDFDAVARAIGDKMVRRHPHVFGDAQIADAAAQTRAWEEEKAEERQAALSDGAADGPSALDGIPLALPALMRAAKLGGRAARTGFDWPDAVQVLAKIDEELAELRAELGADASRDRLEEEFGDLLFACANLARHLELDAEAALRRASGKFEGRFRRVEARLAETQTTAEAITLEEMERLWQEAKRAERPDAGGNNMMRRQSR